LAREILHALDIQKTTKIKMPVSAMEQAFFLGGGEAKGFS
jgi:hypothetical protein